MVYLLKGPGCVACMPVFCTLKDAKKSLRGLVKIQIHGPWPQRFLIKYVWGRAFLTCSPKMLMRICEPALAGTALGPTVQIFPSMSAGVLEYFFLCSLYVCILTDLARFGGSIVYFDQEAHRSVISL